VGMKVVSSYAVPIFSTSLEELRNGQNIHVEDYESEWKNMTERSID